jgi:Fur family zinc uptake transcriptional regulator
MPRTSKLAVHPRDMVLALLRKSAVPLTAYALLDKLQRKGVKSPPIIYRALAELEKQGTVHKIQAIGAYIACNCDADHTHPLSVLTVCGDCKKVSELHDHSIIQHLSKLRGMNVNLPLTAVIELPVTCQQCAA